MKFEDILIDLKADPSGSIIYDVNQLRLRLLAEAPTLSMNECSAISHEVEQLSKAISMLMFSGTVKKWIEEREGA